MKRAFLYAVFGFSCATVLAVDAPVIDGRSAALEKRIDADLSAGKLTKNDGDELHRELTHVKQIEENGKRVGNLTKRTRADLRRDLDKLEKDLERKEKQAQALASPSPH